MAPVAKEPPSDSIRATPPIWLSQSPLCAVREGRKRRLSRDAHAYAECDTSVHRQPDLSADSPRSDRRQTFPCADKRRPEPMISCEGGQGRPHLPVVRWLPARAIERSRRPIPPNLGRRWRQESRRIFRRSPPPVQNGDEERRDGRAPLRHSRWLPRWQFVSFSWQTLTVRFNWRQSTYPLAFDRSERFKRSLVCTSSGSHLLRPTLGTKRALGLGG